MATGNSGSFAVTTSNRYISGTVSWSETYDINSNTSQVTATLRLSRTNTGYETYGSGNFTMTINGNSYTNSGTFSLTYQSGTLCVSHSVSVPHNSDGSKSITIGVSGVIYAGSPNMTLSYQSGTAVLYTIPRASSLSVGNGTLESPMTLTVQRASSAFTHTITYSAGGQSGTVVSGSGSTSVTWTPPASLAQGATTGRSLTCTFTITTYSGGTVIGSAKTAACTLQIPDTDTFRPTFSLSGITRIDGDVPASWGVYVRNKSKASISVSGAAGKYGAGIASYRITCTGGASSQTSTLTAELPVAGAVTFTAVVTDSRGLSASRTSQPITVLDWGPPVITSAGIVRCLEDGTTDANGTYLKISCAWSFSQVGENTVTQAALYSRVGGSGADYTHCADITQGTCVVGNGAFNIGASSDLQIRIADALGGTDAYLGSISTSDCVCNINNLGNGMGIGKYAEEENLLDVKWNQRVRGGLTVDGDTQLMGDLHVGQNVQADGSFTLKGSPVADFVVSYGLVNGWRYRVWKSGWAECWGTASSYDGTVQMGSNGYFQCTLPVTYAYSYTYIIPTTYNMTTATSFVMGNVNGNILDTIAYKADGTKPGAIHARVYTFGWTS